MDCSLPGSSVHGIFQARVLEWGAIAFFIAYTHIIKTYLLVLHVINSEYAKVSVERYVSLLLTIASEILF